MEHTFKNFKKHGHLPREVHGIVVWDTEIDPDSAEEERTMHLGGENWLYKYKVETQEHLLEGGLPTRIINVYVLKEIIGQHRTSVT